MIIESASGKWIAATLDCPRDISAKRIYLYKIKGKKKLKKYVVSRKQVFHMDLLTESCTIVYIIKRV